MTKPVLGVFQQSKLKPVSPAKEFSKKIKISHVASLDIKLSKNEQAKTLISLRRQAGEVLMFANPEAHVIMIAALYRLCYALVAQRMLTLILQNNSWFHHGCDM